MLDILNGNETMGSFLPRLRKVGAKISKFTRPITTKLAKAYLPSSLVDAAAAFDPSKKGAVKKAVGQAKKSAADLLKPSPVSPVTQDKPAFPVNPRYIAIGAAALGALFLIGKRR